MSTGGVPQPDIRASVFSRKNDINRLGNPLSLGGGIEASMLISGSGLIDSLLDYFAILYNIESLSTYECLLPA